MDLKKLNLNPQQEQAVKTTEGPLLVIAGAGSGKTKVLTTRIAYLIDQIGIADKKILAITFTNIAAREMRERIDDLLGYHTNSLICTYHSLCLFILKHDGDALKDGCTDFRIIDQDEKLGIIKQIYRDKQIYDSFGKHIKPKMMNEIIDEIQFATATNDALLWSNSYDEGSIIKKQYKICPALSREFKDYIPSIYREYQRRKRENHWLDFNDLIIGCHKLLTNCKEVATKWSQKFEYILVDEFQDTDMLQFDILSLLVNEKKNVFAVGDPDQTIYEWRGAYSGVFNDFEKNFDHTQIIFLNKNYRSTPQILNAANNLIANNVDRYEKNLNTDNPDNDIVTYYLGDTQHEEGIFIAKKIQELIKNKVCEYHDIAVLYRSNYLSRFIEEALLNANIPYVILGGVKFYQRKEIKDIIAYLQLIVNPNDELAIRRVINVPSRKIGDMTLNNISDYAIKHNLSFVQALKLTHHNHPDITWNDSKISDFFKLITELQQKATDKKPNEITDMVIKTIKYQDYLSAMELPEDWANRMENLEELIRSMKEYEANHENASLNDFLQSITLMTDTTSNDTTTKNKNNVILMTVHTAKGTEWPVVFIAGLYDGVFPHTTNDETTHIEEERRIAFVGITRAKQKLFISSCMGMSYGGKYYPSRFINEIGKENYQKIESSFTSLNDLDLSWYDSKKNVNYQDMYSEKVPDIHVHDTIIHTIFGLGVVIEEDKEFITVAFKHPYGQKTLLKNHKLIKRVKN